MMAKLPGRLFDNGDSVEKNVLLCTSHDRSMSLMVQLVATRVVCANTLSIALGRCTNQIKIAHRGDVRGKEAEARRVLGIADKYFEKLQEAIRYMVDKTMSHEQMEALATVLVPSKTDDGKPSTRAENMRAELNRLFGRGTGNGGSNRWDAMNAVTEYADHFRSVRERIVGSGARFESSLMGSGAHLKQKAFELLTNEDVMANLMKKDFAMPKFEESFIMLGKSDSTSRKNANTASACDR